MKRLLPTCLLLLLALTASAGDQPPPFTSEGYRVPQPGSQLEFPRAHGSHPDYKIEWWYLTGHLFTESGMRFGYQATFFRTALKKPSEQTVSEFGSSQLYLTHMALTDIEGGQFYFEERLSREGWDAWARTDRLDVRNGNWSLVAKTDDVSEMQLQASVDSDVRWRLSLQADKPLIRFGEDGTSRKGPDPEARSYYLSFTRLKTSGTVSIEGEEYKVTGLSWMDHEIASNQLDPDYVGWDWIAIQLNDGWEVKAYLLRERDGTPSFYSALIWIAPNGSTYYRTVSGFEWVKPSFWESPATQAQYPNSPQIKTTHPVTEKPVTLQFVPLLDDQELTLPGTTYWEGAGIVLDASGEEVGSAYLELVGYAGEIEGLR
ncbi:carotenoid 1,2-hydratase [Puniceicoccales bacterium CK1056]|uniref:Carotenoid 1,2-hydratase n=1 Tax=Oceanipulchritudo coccoides TaxID=2706888 RepID=A0A6B2M3V2_9BACT|nr:lipocalin-like domain-containing protein [Oceanipulchritudo coccoides]NDV62784.1 carotenoid 1,2-hydratase [Oceanipulchritudo coccoides]